jgi:hypothetical protein
VSRTAQANFTLQPSGRAADNGAMTIPRAAVVTVAAFAAALAAVYR